LLFPLCHNILEGAHEGGGYTSDFGGVAEDDITIEVIHDLLVHLDEGAGRGDGAVQGHQVTHPSRAGERGLIFDIYIRQPSVGSFKDDGGWGEKGTGSQHEVEGVVNQGVEKLEYES